MSEITKEDLDAENLEDCIDETVQPEKKQFRGAAIHIPTNGKFNLELVGVTIIEAYGAMSLMLECIRNQFKEN